MRPGQQRSVRAAAALSRRGFFLGTAGLALAAAGCGGGGDDGTPGDRFNGTYRAFDSDDSEDVAVSVSVDEDGLLTFWTLLADPDVPFADFGQTFLEDDEFGVTAGGVTTFGQISGRTIFGRTQDASDRDFGFDWRAERIGRPADRPSDDLIGMFQGRARINDIDFFALLGVSPDGNATFFGAFDDVTNNTGDPDLDIDFYDFEGLSFDRSGAGYDYFLDLYGNRIDIDGDLGNSVRLFYTFSSEFPDLEGDTFDVRLDRVRLIDLRSGGRAATRLTRPSRKGLQRAVAGLKKGRRLR